MWRACHIASADSRVAITSRRGACEDVIVERGGSATAASGKRRNALLAILASAALALAGAPARAQKALTTPRGTGRPKLERAAQLPLATDLAGRRPHERTRAQADPAVLRSRGMPRTASRRCASTWYRCRGKSWKDRALFRQVEIDRPLPLTDFDGTTTTHERLAARYRRVAVADGAGRRWNAARRSAGPLVGLMTVDFYGAYLENALDDAAETQTDAASPAI